MNVISICEEEESYCYPQPPHINMCANKMIIVMIHR